MGDLLQPWHLIVLFGFFVPLYFMPGIVSRVRHCKAHNGILVVNLFLGCLSAAVARLGRPAGRGMYHSPRLKLHFKHAGKALRDDSIGLLIFEHHLQDQGERPADHILKP